MIHRLKHIFLALGLAAVRGIRDIRPLNLLLLATAGIVNAFGVTMFLFPVKLYDSGISGLSMLMDQITPANLNISLFLIILNIPVFLLGAKKQGFVFTVYSIFTVGFYSLTAYFIMHVLPIDVSFVSPLAAAWRLWECPPWRP